VAAVAEADNASAAEADGPWATCGAGAADAEGTPASDDKGGPAATLATTPLLWALRFDALSVRLFELISSFAGKLSNSDKEGSLG